MHGLRSIFVGVVEFMAFHHIWMIIFISIRPLPNCLLSLASSYPQLKTPSQNHKTMEICVKSFDGEKYTVEVGVDDTTTDIRRKVASAAELCEDGFDMSFGGKVLAEGDDITQLSAGDTVVLTNNSQKYNTIAALRDLGETILTSERLRFLRDPKLIRLFLQAEVVTETRSFFLSRVTFEALNLSDVPGVTEVRQNFLLGCKLLRTADLSGWNNVTRIGPGFLHYCNALQTVDLSGWNNVTHIEHYFIAHCPVLRTLDLSGWSNLMHVEECFVLNCSALQTLDLSGWRNVQHIGKGFLKGCKIPTSSINVEGSSSVVSEYVKSRNLLGDVKRSIQDGCVCM